MLILSLDATAAAGSAALCDDDALLAEFTVQIGHTHSETLLPMVESVLKTAGHTVADVDLFACTIGPGSFTGVRIGAATIKGLAFGKDRPCIGVSTLEALAYNGIMTDGLVCPVINARRGQVFNALFTVRDGIITRLCDDRALPASELCAALDANPDYEGQTVYLTGDGTGLMLDAGRETTRVRLRALPARLLPVSAYSTAQAALAQYQSGVRTTDAELSPVYLRMSQAERVRIERLGE